MPEISYIKFWKTTGSHKTIEISFVKQTKGPTESINELYHIDDSRLLIMLDSKEHVENK